MRRLISLGLLIAALGSGAPGRATSPAIEEVPVSFSVVNTNTSRTAPACTPDGRRYTVRGTLAAPAGSLDEDAVDVVTLYLHGSGDGSTWNFTAVPGVDHIGEMARLGHASVSLHMLGYGKSDAIDGSAMCFGAWAAVAHQVVQHLRAGTYDANGTAGPAFDRVALVGHSAGGVAATLYSVSYADIDALVIAGWSDFAAFSFTPLYRALARFGVGCARGGRSKDGKPGWSRLFASRDLTRLLYDVDPAARQAFATAYEDDPCGVVKDAGEVLAVNHALSPFLVEVPVLLVYGDHDIFLPGPAELERARYMSSDDVTLKVVADAGHNAMMGRSAANYRAVMSRWLKARGF